MISVLIVLGVVFLLMLAGFLVHLVHVGNWQADLAGRAVALCEKVLPVNQLDAKRQDSNEPQQAQQRQSEKTIDTQAEKTSVLVETNTKGSQASPRRPSAIPVPTIRTAAAAVTSRQSTKTTKDAAASPSNWARDQSPILTIANKSLGSVKSVGSSKTIDTETSRAISTRSSLEVQRKEIALKKKKMKPIVTTARTPEAK